MTKPFSYNLLKQDGSARLGEVLTPRGVIRTRRPFFVVERRQLATLDLADAECIVVFEHEVVV